jgi:Subtilisin inhibitor-like
MGAARGYRLAPLCSRRVRASCHLVGHLVVVFALLAGCGSNGSSGPGDPTQATTDLRIVAWENTRPAGGVGRVLDLRRRGEGRFKTWTLRCDPPGGTFPEAQEACDRLDEVDQPFAETPEDATCTEQYGGPQLLSVQGVYRDETVNARFDRTDGCEIARWDKHEFLFKLEE